MTPYVIAAVGLNRRCAAGPARHTKGVLLQVGDHALIDDYTAGNPGTSSARRRIGVTAGVDDDCAAGQIGCFQAWRQHGTRRPSRRIHVEHWQIAEVPISARSFVAARLIRVEVTTCGLLATASGLVQLGRANTSRLPPRSCFSATPPTVAT